jgi:hypothetical protein
MAAFDDLLEKLKSLQKPRCFNPPRQEAPGFTVKIWRAIKPALSKARAA